MLLKECLDIPCGLRFMVDELQLQSSYGRSRLLQSPFMTSRVEIQKAFTLLGDCYRTLYVEGGGAASSALASLKHRLMCLRDISGTLDRLSRDVVLDDVDLFEIKYLALLAGNVAREAATLNLDGVHIPDLEAVVRILDPDGMKIESFYVYDMYSKELGRIRADIRKLQGLSPDLKLSSPRLLELLEKERLLERDIRENLSHMLKNHLSEIKEGMDALGDLDVLLAKALQMKMMGLCIPKISDDSRTSYAGLFHPYVVHKYETQAAIGGKKKVFIPVDLQFGLESVTIIGANMGGKTVVLKMTALNQLLFQFGFGVAAASATIDIKEDIRVCIGDDQDLASGLSSFAGEVKAIDNVLKGMVTGSRMLALIDEPARTTNPIEGTALVTALLNILKNKKISVLMTTHYNVPGDFFRRLKVRGLVDGQMDYTLEETSEGEIPHEAINVARSLDIDAKWLDEAEKILNENKD
ncbi:MAG: hypothetical protein IJK74_04460 [Bacteroidales bacterium]|nr:hypothetical protein [Bacteroidales bacterium]